MKNNYAGSAQGPTNVFFFWQETIADT